MTDIDTAALRAAHDDCWCLCKSSTTDWDAVRALLDEVDALRAMQERVAELATEYDHYLAFLVGVGARPRNDSEVHDAALAADQLWEALEGSPSTAKERWELGSTSNQQGPQIDAQERS